VSDGEAPLLSGTTEQELVPISVSFEHAAPSSAAAHARLFRCPVRFEQDASELRFPLAWLALPHPSVDPHLRELLELEAKAELERLPERATYGARVRELVRPQLKEAEPTLEAVASRMRMSARTLQRYLKEEGTTFQREIDELRRTVAEHLLREGRASLAEAPLRRAREIRPDRANAYRHLALMLWIDNRPAEAARVLESGLRQTFPNWYGNVHRVMREELAYVYRSWLAKSPGRAAEIEQRARDYNADLTRRDALRVSLAWETDANDVDLHVVDPNGNECFYSNPRTSSGVAKSRPPSTACARAARTRAMLPRGPAPSAIPGDLRVAATIRTA
jgi:AraC-like DNA-binding protein